MKLKIKRLLPTLVKSSDIKPYPMRRLTKKEEEDFIRNLKIFEITSGDDRIM